MGDLEFGYNWADLGIAGGSPVNQQDYGALIADNLDWAGFRDALANNGDQDMTYPDFLNDKSLEGLEWDRVPDDKVPAASAPIEGLALSKSQPDNIPTAKEVDLLKLIVDLSSRIQEHDLLESNSEVILPLKQERNRYQLELYSLQNPSERTRLAKIVSLELEQTMLHLEQLKAKLSPDAFAEDEERAELDLNRIRLRKELEKMKKQQAPVESINIQKVDNLVTGHASTIPIAPDASTDSKAMAGPPHQSLKRRLEQDSDSDALTAEHTIETPTLIQQQRLAGGSMSIFRITANKKPKRSQEQTQNRKDVMNAGGQCLKCRVNRSRPACIGDQVCSECQKEGLECIRPTLKDKNIFIEKLDFTYQPIHSSESSTKRIQFDFVAAITKDFFDFSGHRFIKRNPDLLPLLNKLYGEIVDFGFNPNISNSRKVALGGPCAFNIFVKANTVLCNRHLRLVDDIVEESIRTSVEIEFMERPEATGSLSEDEAQQQILQCVENRKAEVFKNFEGLRGLSSQYFFLVLEEMLSDTNIRKAKKDISKKASLLALIALTLENVLDFADSAQRTKTLGPELGRLLGHLGLVLLAYLKPPSDLAFPKEVPINKCFGENPKSITGVFFEDSFWYELYKASSAALPGHLLQVATEKASLKKLSKPAPRKLSPAPAVPLPPPTAQGARQEYQDRVAYMSRGYMGMNLDFRGKNPDSSYAPAHTTAAPHRTGSYGSVPELTVPNTTSPWWDEEPIASRAEPIEPFGTRTQLEIGTRKPPRETSRHGNDASDEGPLHYITAAAEQLQQERSTGAKRGFRSLWRHR